MAYGHKDINMTILNRTASRDTHQQLQIYASHDTSINPWTIGIN